MKFLKELIKAIFRRLRKPKVTSNIHLEDKEIMEGVVIKKTKTGMKIISNRELSPEELMNIIKSNIEKE
jgi:hypothetical protein